jgi:cyclophilin family peptidyl-prolyl cis-trans isomerase
MTTKNPVVLMKTSEGDITIELNQEKAPLTVANFLNYVRSRYYAGTTFTA